jgi:hypothetical protein
MKDELFNELVASVKEGGTILRGEKEAARSFYLNAIDINPLTIPTPFLDTNGEVDILFEV